MEREIFEWFFQWLKLALDYEGKTIEFGKSKNSHLERDMVLRLVLSNTR